LQLDDETGLCAIKISDERTDWMLAAEFEAVQLPRPEQLP